MGLITGPRDHVMTVTRLHVISLRNEHAIDLGDGKGASRSAPADCSCSCTTTFSTLTSTEVAVVGHRSGLRHSLSPLSWSNFSSQPGCTLVGFSSRSKFHQAGTVCLR